MKTNHRRLLVVLLTLFGLFTCQIAAISQDVEGEGRRGARRPRPTQLPTFIDPQTGQNQFAAQPQPDAGTSEPRDMITLTLWDLTISESTGPEADELVGKLIDQANNLPTVVGTADEVRELVGRLKAAGVLRKLREFRLLMTNGDPAYAQTGASRPGVVATNVSNFSPARSGGRGNRFQAAADPQAPAPVPTPNEPPAPDPIVTNSIQYREIGASVECIPRIDASGGVVVQLKYNSSDVESSPDIALSEVPGRKPVMADEVVNYQVRTTVRLKSGMAIVVQTDAAQTSDGKSASGRTQLLILAASVQPALE